MKFGVCAGVDRAPLLAEAGYDYIELSCAGDLIPDEDDAAWAEKRARIEAMPLPVETFNSYVRSGRIVGPEADWARLERYVHAAAARAAQVGGSVIVFGSGGARRVPDGYDAELARADLLRFLHLAANAYDEHGVLVVIEPLNREECNILTTVREAAGYVEAVGRPGVKNLADTYHMEKDGEGLDAILETGAVLAHAHTADTNRDAPGTGTYDHEALFRALKAVGYDARLSVECRWDDFAAQVGPALAHLRRAHAAANG
jgi:sugar phosphate isomerase/epimerase